MSLRTSLGRLFNSPPAEKASKMRAIIVGDGQEARFTIKNYANYAKETYLKNVVAYRCIDEIARSVASVPLVLHKGDELVEEHWVLELMKRPNPYDSFEFLVTKAMAYQVMDGNAYFEGMPSLMSEGYKELYTHRPDRMQVLVDPSTGLLKGYKYTVNGRSVTWDIDPVTQKGEILHIKGFNPLDDWYGAGPTEATAREIDTSNEATEWNKKLMQNMGRPGMLVMLPDTVSDEEYERLEKQLDNKYGGAQNAGKSIIITGGGKGDVKPYGFSPQELDFLQSNREQARRVAFGYGVPPMLLGIPGDNTYNNQQDARVAFWETTVTFYLGRLVGEFNHWLLGDEEVVLRPDYDQVPALESRREERWKKAQDSKEFLTVNERREIVGFEPVDEGDVIMVSASEIPLGEELDEGDEGEEGKPPVNDDEGEGDDE